jgi:hypothetical protein
MDFHRLPVGAADNDFSKGGNFPLDPAILIDRESIAVCGLSFYLFRVPTWRENPVPVPETLAGESRQGSRYTYE